MFHKVKFGMAVQKLAVQKLAVQKLAKFNLQAFINKNNVKLNNYSEAHLPYSIAGIRDQIVKSKESDNYILTPEDLRKQHPIFLTLFNRYVRSLENNSEPVLWMDMNLYLRTQKSISQLKSNGYQISVIQSSQPAQMQTLEVHTYRGANSDRLKNKLNTNYTLDDETGYTRLNPITWKTSPIFPKQVDYTSLRLIQRQLVLRVQVQIHTPLVVKITSLSGQVSEPQTNIHSIVFENELNMAPKFSEGFNLKEWLALHSLGNWKLINVDSGFDDWPLALLEKQYKEFKESISVI